MKLPTPPAAPAMEHVHVQVFKRDVNRYYSLYELAERWRVEPVTVRAWLYRARRAGHAPKPGQYIVTRKNAVVRWVELRQDYAALLEAIFKSKLIKL